MKFVSVRTNENEKFHPAAQLRIKRLPPCLDQASLESNVTTSHRFEATPNKLAGPLRTIYGIPPEAAAAFLPPPVNATPSSAGRSSQPAVADNDALPSCACQSAPPWLAT